MYSSLYCTSGLSTCRPFVGFVIETTVGRGIFLFSYARRYLRVSDGFSGSGRISVGFIGSASFGFSGGSSSSSSSGSGINSTYDTGNCIVSFRGSIYVNGSDCSVCMCACMCVCVRACMCIYNIHYYLSEKINIEQYNVFE